MGSYCDESVLCRDQVKKILESVSAPVDEEQIKSLVSQLEAKDIAALIKDGKEKLSSCAGAAPAAATGSSSSRCGVILFVRYHQYE